MVVFILRLDDAAQFDYVLPDLVSLELQFKTLNVFWLAGKDSLQIDEVIVEALRHFLILVQELRVDVFQVIRLHLVVDAPLQVFAVAFLGRAAARLARHTPSALAFAFYR